MIKVCCGCKCKFEMTTSRCPECAEKHRQQSKLRRYNPETRAAVLLSQKKTSEKYKEKILAYHKGRYEQEEEFRKASKRRAAKRNTLIKETPKLLEKERKRKLEVGRKFRAQFPESENIRHAKIRAIEKNCMPAWANGKYIALFYKMAQEEQKRTGRPVQVDHIVPITSKKVCGLHTEHNLQLLFLNDNRKKSNVRWPEMP